MEPLIDNDDIQISNTESGAAGRCSSERCLVKRTEAGPSSELMVTARDGKLYRVGF